MKRALILFASTLASLIATSARAQVRYEVDTSTATYATRTGGTTIIEPNQNSTSCTTRTVALPFPFFFDGAVSTEIRVSSNGYLSFGTESCITANDAILDATTPTSHVSLFWDDNEQARVRTFVDGAAPARSFVIQWSGSVRDAVSPALTEGEVNGQITLYEGGLGRMRVHYGPYLPTPGGTVVFDATTGFENFIEDHGAYFLPCGATCQGSDFAAASGNVYDLRVDPASVNLEGYLRSERTEAYEPLPAGTTLALANDGAAAALIAIGFPFEIYGVAVDRINVGVNGVAIPARTCAVAADCPLGYCNAQLVCEYPGIPGTSEPTPNLGAPGLVIAPFWADLRLASGSSIVTELVGSAPNRERVIEWRDVSFAGPAGPTASRANFQLRLAENGTVRFHYGPFAAASDAGLWTSGVMGMEDRIGLSGHRPSIACAIDGSCDAADLASLADTVVELGVVTTVELATEAFTFSSTTSPTPITVTEPGRQIIATLDVSNIGRIPASSFVAEVHLSTDGVLDGGDTSLGSIAVPGVAGRSTRTATAAFFVPSLPPARYQVIVELDALQQVLEQDETNNVFTTSLNLAVGTDLALTNLVIPSSLGWAERFQARTQLRNDGISAQTTPFAVGLYLVPNPGIDLVAQLSGRTAAEVLAAINAAGAVSAGAFVPADSIAARTTVDLAFDGAVPANPGIGNYFMVAVVDSGGAISEFNETNNHRVVPISLVGPDFSATIVSALPQFGFIGGRLSITLQIGNRTTASVNDVAYAVIMSANKEISVPPDTLVYEELIPTMAGSQTRVLTIEVPIPTTLTSTNYYVAAYIDSTFVVPELNELDNLAISDDQVQLTPSAPELRIVALETIEATAIGDVLPVARTFENRGPVGTDVAYEAYLTLDDTLDSTDLLLSRETINLPAYQSATDTDRFLIPSTVPAGTYRVAYFLDSDQAVAEQDEADNVMLSEQSIVVADPYLVILTEVLPAAFLGLPYEAEIAARGAIGALMFTATDGLPPGLSLAPNGVLSGAASEEGVFSFEVTATDDHASVQRTFTIVAVGDDRGLAVLTRVLKTAFLDQPYQFALTADGGARPYAWSAQAPLPPGLVLGADGTITGTPTVAESAVLDFTVEDAVGDLDVRPLVVRVLTSSTALRFADRALSDGSVGDSYDERLQVAVGTGRPPFVMSLESGELPGGLALVGDRIQGTLEEAGDHRFTMRVTDAAGDYDLNTFLVLVSPRNVVQFATTSLPDGIVGRPYLDEEGAIVQIRAFAAGNPVDVGLLSGRLPPGLIMDGAGHLGGIPTATGAYAFSVLASDDLGQSNRRAFGIQISEPATAPPPPPDDGGCGCRAARDSGGGGGGWAWGVLALSAMGALGFARRRWWLASFLALALALPASASAQYSPLEGTDGYAIATRSQPYVELTGGLELINGADSANPSTPMPFPFTYFGQTYTTLHVSSDGFVAFETFPATSYTNYAFPNINGPENMIAGWWDDFEAGRVTVHVTGSAPDRAMIVQWDHSERFGTTPEGALNFQIRLLERGSRIQIHYGPYQSLGGTTVFSGTIGMESAGMAPIGAQFIPCGTTCSSATYSSLVNTMFEVVYDRGPDVSAIAVAPEFFGPLAELGSNVLFVDSPFPLAATLGSFHALPIGPFRYAIDLVSQNDSTRSTLFESDAISLDEFATTTSSLALSIDAATPLGPYRIEMVVDRDGDLAEIDASNNIATSEPFELRLPQSDFAAVGIEGSGVDRVPGETFDLAVEVGNVGPLGGSVQLSVVLSPDPSASTTDLEIGATTVDVAATSSLSVSIPCTIPADLATGRYYLGLITDGADLVVELDELNNDLLEPTSILVALPGDPMVVTTALPGGYVGSPYSAFLRGGGGDGTYSWGLDSETPGNALPPGLTLVPSTGELHGTPVTAWSDPFTVRLYSANRSASATLTIEIDEVGVGSFRILATQLIPGVVGQSYPPPGSQPRLITRDGDGDVRFSLASEPPPGITLDTDGTLGGVPTTVGDFSFEVTAIDSAGAEASASFTLTVYEEGRVRVVLAPIPDALVREPFSHQFEVVGQSSDRVRFSAEGALPTGLRITPIGQLVGTPVAVGISDFVVTAEDLDSGLTDSKSFQLRVVETTSFAISPTALPNAVTGEPYEAHLTAISGTAPFVWSLMGELPDGLSLDIIASADGEAAIIHGVPARAEFSVFIMELEDRNAQSAEGLFSILVEDPPAPPPPTVDDGGCGCTAERSGGAGSLFLLMGLFLLRRPRRASEPSSRFTDVARTNDGTSTSSAA